MFGGSSANLKRPQSVYNPTSAVAREGMQNEPNLDQDQEKKYQEIIDLLGKF